VAAFFDYKSRIAMLADKKYPISNLAQAEFILLDPPAPFVDQRIKNLAGLSSDLPPSYMLVEAVYSVITDDKELLEKIQPSFHDLAIFLAEERLHQETKMWAINSNSSNWIKDVTIQELETEAVMTVSFGSRTAKGEHLRYRKYVIYLPRVAANLGYGTPRIEETRYSADAAKYSEEELLKKYPVSAVIA
jgi:hypothetical protein